MTPEDIPIEERPKLLDAWTKENTEAATLTYNALVSCWPSDLDSQINFFHYATSIYAHLMHVYSKSALQRSSETDHSPTAIVYAFFIVQQYLVEELAIRQCTERYEKSITPALDELKKLMEL